MFDKIITFSSHEDYVNLKEDHPVPIKTNIPDWYKKLSHSPTYRTAKGCMPFLDTLTTGYLLKLPRDIYIQHNVENKETKKKDSFTHGAKIDPGYLHSRGLNINHDLSKDIHPIDQLKGSPHVEKNKSLPGSSFIEEAPYEHIDSVIVNTEKEVFDLIREYHEGEK